MKIITGLAFVVAAIVLALLFKAFIVNPSTQQVDAGRYGELYGPIMFLRFIVYGLCVAQAASGLLILFVFK